jgi:hypothetical protein
MCEPEQGRQAHAGIHQRPGPERRDAVTELVEGDHTASHRGAHDHELLLGEADRQ